MVFSQAIGVSPALLARNARTGRFSTVESARLVALIAVFEDALALFEEDLAATTEGISTPVRELGSATSSFMDVARERIWQHHACNHKDNRSLIVHFED